MGAAEISALIKDYTRSYIMTFAGYNAGRGRVQQWVAQRGDPRNPKIDAVDWVEHMPLAETRNYAQRVMENLLRRGDVDGSKPAVTGGSAGGFTTLCGLTFHTEFAVGASYYGISDLVALATQTLKFELHYTDWLIEPFKPGSALYHDRSPINFVNRLSAPVIFLHGKDDPIVPINQADKMYSALKDRNISTCLLVFEGEKHGFRQSAHLRQALEAELLLYSMNLTRAPLTS
jgi:dienelactone hydrolase